MAANHAAVATIAGSTPISSTAYTTLFASTPFNTTKVVLSSSCDQIVSIAIGPAGSEVDLVAVNGGGFGSTIVDIGLNICPKGSRISVLAQGQSTSSGYLTVSLLP